MHSRIVDIAAIEARRKEVAEELERLEREMDELDMAMRVFSRFSVEGDAGREPQQFDTGPKLGPARPDGIPSNYDMAVDVIWSAMKSGRKGLTAAELVEEIGKRWWPGVQGPQILPIMYQFAKRGRLVKGGDGYFRLPASQREEASPAQAGEASKPEDEGTANPDIFE